jgi:membrane fusion protein (multidrug efflux system)
MRISNTLIAISIASYSLVSCGSETKQATTAAKPFPVVEVGTTDVQSFYTFPAEISGKNNNQVRPKISGYIQQVLVDEGEKVKKGQILFKLETNIQTQNADAAKAQISAAQSNIEAAKATVNAAQVEVDKLLPLVEKNIISNVQLETARANLLKAKGQLSQARAGYENAKANYEGVNENIKFSTVTSPIEGVVGKLNYRVGALASPTDPNPLTTVSEVSEIYAYFSLNEKQYIYFFNSAKGNTLEEKIQTVPLVQLELADGSIYKELGKIETSTGQIDPNTGTIQFRVKFDNKNRMLSNGSTGKIKIPRTYKDALVVPESATFEQQGYNYVYRLVGDSVKSTVISIKDRIGNIAIIESGLSKGDIVVAKGVGNLKNGMKITPEKQQLDSLIKIEAIR